jgi:hypothetical protein
MDKKRTWDTPVLTQYGAVSDITAVKCGSVSDDQGGLGTHDVSVCPPPT